MPESVWIFGAREKNMPAKKPASLIPINETKADRAARVSAEMSMIPKTELTNRPPAALKGHKLAPAVWKKIVNLYASTDGKIATSFDEDLLIQYCLCIEELPWLSDMRTAVEGEYKAIQKQVTKLRSAKMSDEGLKNYLSLLNQLNALLTRLQSFDARIDGKRKLIHSLSQSLYLTPRSRAGVAPAQREEDDPMDEMETLLNSA